MREILFRGKPSKNGKWVFGCYYKQLEFYGDACDDHIIITSPEDLSFDIGLDYFVVEPETVGQFTGLIDKNGTKIFEGDIVRVLGNQQVEDWKNVDYIGSIAFLDAGFCVIDGTIEDHAFRRYALPRLDFDLEVIGNIYDNPEVLEE